VVVGVEEPRGSVAENKRRAARDGSYSCSIEEQPETCLLILILP
jgi:hypothetical protein